MVRSETVGVWMQAAPYASMFCPQCDLLFNRQRQPSFVIRMRWRFAVHCSAPLTQQYRRQLEKSGTSTKQPHLLSYYIDGYNWRMILQVSSLNQTTHTVILHNCSTGHRYSTPDTTETGRKLVLQMGRFCIRGCGAIFTRMNNSILVVPTPELLVSCFLWISTWLFMLLVVFLYASCSSIITKRSEHPALGRHTGMYGEHPPCYFGGEYGASFGCSQQVQQRPSYRSAVKRHSYTRYLVYDISDTVSSENEHTQ